MVTMGVSRLQIILILTIIVIFLLGFKLFTDRDTYKDLYYKSLGSASAGAVLPGQRSNDDVHFTLAQVIQLRNNMSRILNLKQQKIGQMECESNSKGRGEKVSSTGGWCAQTSVENSGQHKTDTQLVPVLAEFFKDKYVASFGDGPGRYKQLLLDTGLLKGYDAYDGAPFSEKTSEGRVQYLDLTLPQYGLPLYDWVISLEVAEHIPREYESSYIDNMVRHAKEGIVMSWAKPGQSGYSHINNRPFEYVKSILGKQGFEHDSEASDRLKKAAKLEWLQWNTNVYRRKDLSNIEHIRTVMT